MYCNALKKLFYIYYFVFILLILNRCYFRFLRISFVPTLLPQLKIWLDGGYAKVQRVSSFHTIHAHRL